MNSRPNRNESQSHPGNSPDALSDPQRPSTRASGKPQRPRVSAPQPRPDDQAALCRRGIVTIPNPGQRAAVNRGPLTSAPLSLRSFIPPIAQQCATTRERGKAILPPRQHPDVASKNPLHQKTGRSQRNLQRAGKARPARRRHCNRRALIKAQKQMPLILCQPLGARFPCPEPPSRPRFEKRKGRSDRWRQEACPVAVQFRNHGRKNRTLRVHKLTPEPYRRYDVRFRCREGVTGRNAAAGHSGFLS